MNPADLHVVPPFDPIKNVRNAAQSLADARVEFATQFCLAHAKWRGTRPLTDRQAAEATIAATKDAVTLAGAEYAIALYLLKGDA